ncbi:MAG: c-type cytochrome [Gemmatimonadota bacterium]|nr:c-type cytochrome [Gemmatimonadota bacterium]
MSSGSRKARYALPLLIWSLTGCWTPSPNLSRGEALFDTCRLCHGSDGLGNPGLQAPAIAGLPQWYIEAQLEKFQTGIRGAHSEDAPGMLMRPSAVALHQEGDIEAVAEHVASLSPDREVTVVLEGQAEAGAATYTGVCSACHGPDATGNEVLGAPPLVLVDAWYMLAQLRNFKTGIRGSHPRDTWGMTMRINAEALSDDDMKDVITYISTLR